ncbi:MAG: DUF2723 domain-containing protein [Flavobacteriia bacterium]|nr:DUF2723 domain-containing protein [Flavobacteriia bacterium]
MNYRLINITTGWIVFLISTIVYFLTIEDTVSLWDCGEYITAAYKLEVGHPPGAPLFMVLGRLFTFFAAPENVAIWINRMSALSSSFSILFLFWSITMFAKKMMFQTKRELSSAQIIAIIGSGLVGSLVYTFSDSFWFSAVEGEVYAMSSLFTAIIFWATLKWDEEMDAKKFNELDENYVPMRWMILIMFLFGLAIGVHLLGLLVVPAIAYVIYFNQWSTFSWKTFFITGIVSIFILGFIQEGIIPGTIALASGFEVAFVNSMGLPFYSGTIFFFLLLIIVCIYIYRWSKKKNKPLVNAAILGLIVFLIGYGSFAVIVIRSNANTPLDENDPENLVTLHAYLKREQYGSWPILKGPYWNSNYAEQSEWGDRSRFYARRFVVVRSDQDIKAFKEEKSAQEYAKTRGRGYEVVEKYFVSNEESRKGQEPTYEQTTFFPRMYWNQDPPKIQAYKDWSGYTVNGDDGTGEKGSDGQRLPTFGENLRYFTHYQLNWMYFRYFMWNFAGRQNDIQGHGDAMRGNWISGFSSIDNLRLGKQDKAPFYTTENPANNTFYFIPLILGLIGMIFHFYKAPKDAFVVLLTFFFTGLAIVVYLNQKPFEPRERDYAYAASFYIFAIWIGLGVLALFQAFIEISKKHTKSIASIFLVGAIISLLCDLIFNGSYACLLSYLYVAIISIALFVFFAFIGKKWKNEKGGAVLATVLSLIAPVLMAVQGWDDHDRSEKTSAWDLAYNYLESCSPNSIIFTNGDNDTFPLWYLQEVEEKRTDVRVCNLSLMQTDWYTEQMKMKAYDSEPLPILFREDQTMMYSGNTDQVYFLSLIDLLNSGVNKESIRKIVDLKIKYNKSAFEFEFEKFKTGTYNVAKSLTAKDPNFQATLSKIQNDLSLPVMNPTFIDVDKLINACVEILTGYGNGILEGPQEALQQFQTSLRKWEETWDYLPLSEAMAFVRDDNNLINNDGRLLRVFPSKGFILPVDKKAVVKSGLLTEEEVKKAQKEIRFKLDKQAISREQVMMLDIIANNNWKRNIYFSSPGGSEVSISLYTSGFVKQNGMAFELNPLREQEIVAKNKMHENLIKKYSYGKMNKKGVLTDYYTRRHTSQFRDHFSRLSDAYLRENESILENKNRFEAQIKSFEQVGQKKTADSLRNVMTTALNNVESNNKKVKDLIAHSLKVMPLELVIDYGEPNPSREKFDDGTGMQYEGYDDGVLHEYVGLLFRAGDKKGAEDLGLKVAKQLESIFDYFEYSKASFSIQNKNDLVAALNSYMLLTTYANDPEKGYPNGKLAQHTQNKIQKLYNNTFPRIYNELRNEMYDNKTIQELKAHLDAIAMKYGFIEKPVSKVPGSENKLTPEQIQELMKQAGQ